MYRLVLSLVFYGIHSTVFAYCASYIGLVELKTFNLMMGWIISVILLQEKTRIAIDDGIDLSCLFDSIINRRDFLNFYGIRVLALSPTSKTKKSIFHWQLEFKV